MRLPKAETLDKWHFIAIVLVSVAFLLPIWFTRYPPLLDWPNHLARAYILAWYAKVPEFQSAFNVRWDLLPNLGVDILGMVLLRWLPYSFAGKIILSLAVLLFVAGCIWVSLGFYQRISLTTVVAAYFAYNFMFLYGFVNYALGIGLFLLTYGYWLRSTGTAPVMRVVLLVLLGTTCFFTHLSSFVFLTLALLVHLIVSFIQRRLSAGYLLYTASPLFAPLILFALYNTKYGGTRGMHELRWEGIYSKIKGLAYAFASYDFVADSIFGLILVVLLFSCITMCHATIKRTGVLLAAIFTLSFIVLPTGGYAGTWAIDRRFVVPAAVILLLSINPSRSTNKKYFILLATASLLLFARVAWIWSQWHIMDRRIERQIGVFAQVFQYGDSIYPVVLLNRQDKQKWVQEMAFGHVICYAVITRHAFTPSLFAYAGQQPIKFRDPRTGYIEIYPPFPSPENLFDVALLKTRYDYVYGFRLTADYECYFNRHFNLVYRDKDVLVFATKQQASSPPPSPRPSPSGKARDDSPTRADPPSR